LKILSFVEAAMSYVVSARKYRPSAFDEVVGQGHITKTLENEISTDHLAQAFLFCGPRGVGKTTCARILAKEINKNHIEDQSYDYSFNIFELDAASNNTVEDIRQLNEQVRIPPQLGKYKVYIIDEVHMLSANAFNAFLKTLEEPPPYAVFILATTERHKILPTILSRCQIFNFDKISIMDIVDHLKKIASKEGVEVDENALHVIAQKADGALRDALSMFDQMVSVGTTNAIKYAEVVEHLNVLDYDYFFRLTDAFQSQDVSQVLLTYDEIFRKGFDGQLFLNGLANHFRDLMVSKDTKMAGLLELPDQFRPKYVEASKALGQGFLVNAMNLCSSYELSFKSSQNERLHVEMALIKICYLKSLVNTGEKKKPS
jgi:DNA polymerase-3 subunit gamma/tau